MFEKEISHSGLDFNDFTHAKLGLKGRVFVDGNIIAVDGLSGNDTVSASTGSDNNLGEILIGGLGNDVTDGGDVRAVKSNVL